MIQAGPMFILGTAPYTFFGHYLVVYGTIGIHCRFEAIHWKVSAGP